MASSSPPPPPPDDLEWEEWDSSTSPLSFPHHCLAGSFAGVAEHTLLYPLDTVKTCWQSQVLHKAGMGCGEPCGINETVNKFRGAGTGASSEVMGSAVANPLSRAAALTAEANKTTLSSTGTPKSASSSNIKVNNAPSQGIWSTMKNLMRQGHHHHHGHHQFSHAHVYTLAGNPPNVVDLTTNNGGAAETAVAQNNKTKRPWSKQSRAVRNATTQDITAQGMIRSASGGGSAMIDATTITQHNGNAGVKRLWRGVQTMFVGCIPAHALYFSSYEAIKSICTDQGVVHHQSGSNSEGGEPTSQQHEGHVGHDTLSPAQAMLAGGVATLLHDFIMTPMDTMKQRMQLGHYDNLRHAFVSIVWGDSTNSAAGDSLASKVGGEGWRGLYRSFPVTVMTNVPYGMIMMTTNEWLRGVLEDGLYGIHRHHEDNNPFHFPTILLSGMGAGAIASAATAPLDRVKTRLQTQRMGMVLPTSSSAASGSMSSAASGAIMEERALAAAQGKPQVCPKAAVQGVKQTLFPSASTMNSIPSSIQLKSNLPQTTLSATPFKTYYSTPLEAFQSILQEEGPRGLFRGTLPRVALHAPSVAISWTAYEMAKDCLISMQ